MTPRLFSQVTNQKDRKAGEGTVSDRTKNAIKLEMPTRHVVRQVEGENVSPEFRENVRNGIKTLGSNGIWVWVQEREWG